MSINQSNFHKANHTTDKSEYRDNLELATTNSYAQKFKTKLIELVNDDSFDELKENIRDYDKKTASHVNDKLVIKNGENNFTTKDLDLDVVDFYNKYHIRKDIEDIYFNGNVNNLDEADKYLYNLYKSESNSLIQEYSKLHLEVSKEFSEAMKNRQDKFENQQDFHDNDYKYNKDSYQLEFEILLSERLSDTNYKFDDLISRIELESNEVKKILVGDINNQQKKMRQNLSLNNNATIHGAALAIGKKTHFGTPSEQEVFDLKATMYQEVYKMIVKYNPNKIGTSGQIQPSTLLSYIFKAKINKEIKEHYKNIEKEKNNKSIIDIDGNSIDAGDLDNDDSEEFGFFEKLSNRFNLLDEKDIMDFMEKKNIVKTFLTSKRDIDETEKNLLKGLLYGYDELKNQDKLDENWDYVEFMKAAIIVEKQESFIEKDIHNEYKVEANREWITTYKTYKAERLSTIGSMGKDARMFLAFGEEKGLTYNRGLQNPAKLIVNLVKEHMEDSIKSSDEDGELKFKKEHQKFLKKLIEMDIPHIEKEIQKDIANDEKIDLNKLRQLEKDDMKSVLLSKPYAEAEVELKKEKLSIDSKLISIKANESNPLIVDKTKEIDKTIDKANVVSVIPQLNKKQYLGIKNSIAAKQTNGNYSYSKDLMFGKYQLDVKTLSKFGILDKGKLSDALNKSGLDYDGYKEVYNEFVKNPDNWNKKYCNSLDGFLGNKKLQEELMDLKLCSDYKEFNSILKNDSNSKIKSLDELRPWEVSGVLVSSHINDASDTKEVLIDGKDNILKSNIVECYSLGRESSLIDMENTLRKLEKYSNNKEYNFNDNQKNFSQTELLLNPAIQMEYFVKEIFDVFKNISSVYHNIKSEQYHTLKKDFEEEKVSSKLDRILDNDFKETNKVYNNNNKHKK